MRITLPEIGTEHWHKRLSSAILEFVILFVFWLLLSGHYQAKYIIFGVISAALVTFLTNDLFHAVLRHGEGTEPDVRAIFKQLGRFIAYIPWLLGQIVLANVQVAYLVLHPRMPIEPGFLLFSTRMHKGMSQVTLANSITLTPGTITVSLEGGNYIIHNLKPPLAQSLVDGQMQSKVAHVYLETEKVPPEVRWAHSLEELKK
jgi:multicomponent Na+:H+ antiporter subunit E